MRPRDLTPDTWTIDTCQADFGDLSVFIGWSSGDTSITVLPGQTQVTVGFINSQFSEIVDLIDGASPSSYASGEQFCGTVGGWRLAIFSRTFADDGYESHQPKVHFTLPVADLHLWIPLATIQNMIRWYNTDLK